MKTIRYLVLVSFFFFGLQSMGQENNRIQAGSFQLIDGDGNGIITIRELTKYQEGKTNEKGEAIDTELMFYGLDGDNNSIITISEYTKGVDWEAVTQNKTTKRRRVLSSNNIDDPSKNYEADQGETFQLIDSDGNGIITIRELTKYEEGKTNEKGGSIDAGLMFNHLDSDNNRIITIKEYTKGESWEASKERNENAGLAKEAKRKEVAATALARKEERQQIEQFDREEKMRLKEELHTQRNEKVRLAEEDIKRIKAKNADERRQADKLVKQKKEAEQLTEQQHQADQLTLEREKSIASTAEKTEAKRLAEEKKIDDQRKAGELETQRQQVRRLADMERQQERERLAKERRLAEELVNQKKEAERLAKVKLEKEVRRAEVLEEQRKKQAKIDEEQAKALAMEQREAKRKAREEEKKRRETLLKVKRLEEKRLAELRLEELQKQESEEQRLAEKAKKEMALFKLREEERLAEERKIEDQHQSKLIIEQKRELELQAGPKRKEEELIKEIEGKELAISKRTYIIIKGNKWDNRMFKDLKEFLEFDFDAADIDVKTVIYDNNDNVSPSKVWSSLKRKYGNVVLLEQTGYNDLGESELHIKFLKQGDDSWRELGIDKCDLGSDKELDRFSKRLAELRLEELQKQEGEEQILTEKAEKEEKLLEEQKRNELALSKQREEERLALQTKRLSNETDNSETSNSNKAKESIEKAFAFIIIRGNEEDKKQFEDLEDYIEFDFMFAKAKLKTVIFNKNQSTILNDILPNLSEENNVIMLIDQKEHFGEGASKYQISIINKQIDTEWKEASSHSYNLNLRTDLKQLSKKITNYLSN